MNSNLDTDTPPFGIANVFFLPNAPPISPEVLPRFDDHVPDQLPLLHQSSTESFGTRPRLRATAVKINTATVRRNER